MFRHERWDSSRDEDIRLAPPGTPKEREYQVTGVLADHNIGQSSDVAIVFVPG